MLGSGSKNAVKLQKTGFLYDSLEVNLFGLED